MTLSEERAMTTRFLTLAAGLTFLCHALRRSGSRDRAGCSTGGGGRRLGGRSGCRPGWHGRGRNGRRRRGRGRRRREWRARHSAGHLPPPSRLPPSLSSHGVGWRRIGIAWRSLSSQEPDVASIGSASTGENAGFVDVRCLGGLYVFGCGRAFARPIPLMGLSAAQLAAWDASSRRGAEGAVAAIWT